MSEPCEEYQVVNNSGGECGRCGWAANEHFDYLKEEVEQLRLEKLELQDKVNGLQLALEDIYDFDATSTLNGAIAIAASALGRPVPQVLANTA